MHRAPDSRLAEKLTPEDAEQWEQDFSLTIRDLMNETPDKFTLDAPSDAKRKHHCFVKAVCRYDRDQPGPAFGQGVGLVDHKRIDLLEPLRGFSIPDENAAPAPLPTPTMIDMGVASPNAQAQVPVKTLSNMVASAEGTPAASCSACPQG